MSSIESVPAAMPATRHGTFTAALTPHAPAGAAQCHTGGIPVPRPLYGPPGCVPGRPQQNIYPGPRPRRENIFSQARRRIYPRLSYFYLKNPAADLGSSGLRVEDGLEPQGLGIVALCPFYSCWVES